MTDRSWRVIAALCAALLLLSTLPLYAISFYNHPYYDDYGFSAESYAVWRETGDLGATVAQAWRTAQTVRQTWQGTYTGTFLSCLQPGVFGQYWLTGVLLLTAWLAGLGALCVQGLRLLRASRAQTVALACLALFVATQFLPDPDEAFYWFNGGVGNSFVYAMIFGSFALLLSMERGAKAWPRAAALFVLFALLGGGSYGGGLFVLLAMGAAVLVSFCAKSKRRWLYLALTAWLACCFLYSFTAPGNGVRAGVVGGSASAVKAVAKALYYGTALAAEYTRLPLMALMLLLAPVAVAFARRTTFRFRRPLLALLFGWLLFCAQLCPPLYGGVFLGGGRIQDTYYASWIVLALAGECYVLGWAVKRFALTEETVNRFPLTGAFRRGVLALSACALLLGCMGCKNAQDTLYGPQNLAGAKAALSLISGEAQTYDAEMDAREALLEDETQPVVTLAPLSAVPDIFMKDLLAPDAAYDVRPALCAYYGKEAVLTEGGAAQ
ncbi:MAG: hypothetical protein PHY12_10230 [Eubacteriales bacterium]|nr:hypothetical protein [Eubacteriales bacterium]